MAFKSGLLVGFGIGYVLGAKAGRERYEELRQAWERFRGNPQVKTIVDLAEDVVNSGTQAGLRAVQGGVEKAAGAVKDRLGEE